MPFTPIHLGPGLAFKAIGGRHFSLMVFGGAQVLMDLEPLIGILQDRDGEKWGQIRINHRSP